MTEEYKFFLELQQKSITLTQNQQDEYKGIKDILEQSNDYVASLYENGQDVEAFKMFDFETGDMVNAKKYYDDLAKAEDTTKSATNGLTDANGNLIDSLSDVGDEADSTTNSIEDMANSFSKATDKISLLKDVMKEFQDNSGTLSSDTISKVLSSGDTETIALLGDRNTLLEKGQAIVDRETASQKANYDAIIQSSMAEQNKTAIATNGANTQAEATADATDSNAEQYGADVENKSNAETSKVNATGQAKSIMSKNNGDLQDILANQYKTDVYNKINAENSKGKAVGNVNNGMLSSSANTVNQLGQQYKTDSENFRKSQLDKLSAIMSPTTSISDFMGGIDSINEAEKNKVTSVMFGKPSVGGGSYSPVKVGYDPVGYSPVGIDNSGKGSGSSSTEKEVEDIKDLIDIYYDLQNAIDELSARQTYLKTTREGTFGKEYLANLQQELVLLEKQQQAVSNMANGIKNERWDLIRDLEGNWGFTFGSQGEVTNYKTRLKELMDYANSLTGETKENFKSALEEVSDKLQNYTDLTINQTNDMSNQWQEYNNQIKETYRLMGEAQSDAEGKISETYKHILQERLDTTKKYIDEIKNKLNTQWDEEEYADQKQVAQQTLLDIRSQINNAVKSGDKELIADLQKQYTEQQKTVNDMIRDHEREQITDKLDKEESKLDEQLAEMLKPENLNQTIQTALQEGYFKIGDEIISVQESMKNLTEDTVEGFLSQKIALDEYLRSFSTGIEMAKQLGNITSNLGLVSSINNVPVIPSSSYASVNNNANSKTIQINSPLIQIDHADNSTITQVQGIVDNAINNLAKQIDNQYKI